MILRKVNNNDVDLLFSWINDPIVRDLSFTKNPIELNDHKIWFKKKYKDPNILMWILENHCIPLGLVRLEKNGCEVNLNYLIAPDSRGQGLAPKMLIKSINQVKQYWNNIHILAYTLPENIASIKSLERAGFKFKSKDAEKICYTYQIR